MGLADALRNQRLQTASDPPAYLDPCEWVEPVMRTRMVETRGDRGIGVDEGTVEIEDDAANSRGLTTWA